MTKKPTAHLFFVRYSQWTMITCAFNEEITEAGGDFFAVCNKKTRKILIDSGLFNKENTILTEDLEGWIAASTHHSIEVYVQASRHALEKELIPFFQEHLGKKGVEFTLSLYPDGYTNKAYAGAGFSNFVTRNGMVHGSVYSFDVEAERGNEFSNFSKKVISSKRIRSFTNSETSRKECAKEYASLDIPHSSNVILIMLRPWGSKTFLNGRFEIPDAIEVMSNLIIGLISQVQSDVSNRSVVLIRPDHRDVDLSEVIVNKLLACHDHKDIKVAGESWPKWMTFDPFIDQFSENIPGGQLHTITLDSTAALPFLALGVGHAHYIGFPFGRLSDNLKSSNAFQSVKLKVRDMEKFIRSLPQDHLLVSEIDSGFIKASVNK